MRSLTSGLDLRHGADELIEVCRAARARAHASGERPQCESRPRPTGLHGRPDLVQEPQDAGLVGRSRARRRRRRSPSASTPAPAGGRRPRRCRWRQRMLPRVGARARSNAPGSRSLTTSVVEAPGACRFGSNAPKRAQLRGGRSSAAQRRGRPSRATWPNRRRPCRARTANRKAAAQGRGGPSPNSRRRRRRDDWMRRAPRGPSALGRVEQQVRQRTGRPQVGAGAPGEFGASRRGPSRPGARQRARSRPGAPPRRRAPARRARRGEARHRGADGRRECGRRGSARTEGGGSGRGRSSYNLQETFRFGPALPAAAAITRAGTPAATE